MHNNLIEKIENLDDLTHLSTLNLSGNRIKELSGLSNLKQLTNLYVEKNNIETVEAIKPILDCTYLAVVSILKLNKKKLTKEKKGKVCYFSKIKLKNKNIKNQKLNKFSSTSQTTSSKKAKKNFCFSSRKWKT